MASQPTSLNRYTRVRSASSSSTGSSPTLSQNSNVNGSGKANVDDEYEKLEEGWELEGDSLSSMPMDGTGVRFQNVQGGRRRGAVVVRGRKALIGFALVASACLILYYILTLFIVFPSRESLQCSLYLRTHRSTLPTTPSDAILERERRKSDPSLPRAKQISGMELIDSYLSASATTTSEDSNYTVPHPAIPRLIHQSWKSLTIPPSFQPFLDSFLLDYPSHTHVLWTNADNRLLVSTYFPELLDVYDSFPEEILRADFVRNLYLWKFGGIYADLDVESLRNAERYLEDDVRASRPSRRTESTSLDGSSGVGVGVDDSDGDGDWPVAFVASMGKNLSDEISIPNAWMASTPSHPFWLKVVNRSTELFGRYPPGTFGLEKGEDPVEHVTGPIVLFEVYEQWVEDVEAGRREGGYVGVGGDVIRLDSGKVFPFSWKDAELLDRCLCFANDLYNSFDPLGCQALYPEAYQITYWKHSWDTGIMRRRKFWLGWKGVVALGFFAIAGWWGVWMYRRA